MPRRYDNGMRPKDLLREAEARAEAAAAEIKRAEEQILAAKKAMGDDRDLLLIAVLRILRELRNCADGAGIPAARRRAAEFSGGPVYIAEGGYGLVRQKIFDLLLEFDLVTEDGTFKFWFDGD